MFYIVKNVEHLKKEDGMKNLSKLFVVVGFALLLVALVLRVTPLSITVGGRAIRLITYLILANTSFLLAILSKK